MPKPFTEHPQFLNASRAANHALRAAAIDLGLEPSVLDNFETSCNRLADDLTRLMLRALDANTQRRAA